MIIRLTKFTQQLFMKPNFDKINCQIYVYNGMTQPSILGLKYKLNLLKIKVSKLRSK